MKFELGKYTEITDLAFQLRPSYKEENYVRFSICPDVHDTWFVRILEGYNKEYEEEEGCFVMERNDIENDYKGQPLNIERTIQIIQNDQGDSWDIFENHNIEDLISDLDEGNGINNLKK